MLVLALPAGVAADGAIELNQVSALAGIGAGDPPGYPILINQPGVYRLTGDLAISDPNTDGISVNSTTAERTTIDLNGFSIVGPALCTGAGAGVSCTSTGTGLGIRGGAQVTVRNGRVVGAGANGLALGENARIEDLTVRSCGTVGLSCGEGCRVARVLSQQNGSNGMSLGAASQVIDSAMRGNGGHGVRANQEASTIQYNVVIGNAFIGVVAFDGATVLGNVIRGNGTWGLSGAVGANSGYAHNVFTANGTGPVIGAINLGNNACSGAICP
jgi:hypothetical protein